MQDGLCAFGFLAGTLLYLRDPVVAPVSAFRALPFLAFALLAKETAVSYMLALPAFDVWLGRRSRVRQLAATYGVLTAMVCAYLLARPMFAPIGSDFFESPSRYFVKQLLVLPYKFFVQPWSDAFVGAPALAFTVSAIAIACFSFAVIRRRVSRRLLLGPLLILATTLPVYSYFFVRPDLMSARYLYLPAVGWSILLADFVTSALRSRLLLYLTLIVVVAGYTLTLHVNMQAWRTAAAAIQQMETARSQGADPLKAVQRWNVAQNVGLEFNAHGIPTEYKGVRIFPNGYSEFIAGSSAHLDKNR